MGRSLKYEIPGDDPRVSPDEIASSGFARLFARARARARARSGGAEAGPAASGGGADPSAPLEPADTPARRLVLEIGFGRGEFLLALAEASPDADFVGDRGLLEARPQDGAQGGSCAAPERAAHRRARRRVAARRLRPGLPRGALGQLLRSLAEAAPRRAAAREALLRGARGPGAGRRGHALRRDGRRPLRRSRSTRSWPSRRGSSIAMPRSPSCPRSRGA